MASFVISVLGDDRAGLVGALSGVITEHGGNWERSHMTQLAGKFAGVVLVTMPADRSDGFASALEALEHSGLLHLSVERGIDSVRQGRDIEIRVTGNDRPGIVHELSQLLARRGVNIDDLETRTSPAPMGGGSIFEAVARLTLPSTVASDALVDAVEALAADLMVDIDFPNEI
jgi:glycine cleavage system regulatory protein